MTIVNGGDRFSPLDVFSLVHTRVSPNLLRLPLPYLTAIAYTSAASFPLPTPHSLFPPIPLLPYSLISLRPLLTDPLHFIDYASYCGLASQVNYGGIKLRQIDH
jgi:hypothetical protein